MNKLLVFPFTSKQVPFLKYNNLFTEKVVIIPYLANSVNMNCNDLSYLNNNQSLIIDEVASDNNIYKYFDKDIEFIFCNSNNTVNMIDIGIDICKELNFREQQYSTCLSLKSENLVNSIDNSILNSRNRSDKSKNSIDLILPKEEKLQIKDISSTIIGVGSVVSDADKSEVCLSLSEYYMNKGYSVATIMSDSIYQYIGANFIEFGKLIKFGLDVAIYYINNYIYELSKTKDIIIIEIPGSFIKYNANNLDSSGVYAFILSQAIYIERIVCCLPINYNNKEYYQYISKVLSEKFEYKYIDFHLSNFLPEFKHRTIYFDIPGLYINKAEYKSVLNKIKESGINIHNLKDRNSIDQLLE